MEMFAAGDMIPTVARAPPQFSPPAATQMWGCLLGRNMANGAAVRFFFFFCDLCSPAPARQGRETTYSWHLTLWTASRRRKTRWTFSLVFLVFALDTRRNAVSMLRVFYLWVDRGR